MKFSANELLQQGAKAHKIGNVQKVEQLHLSVLKRKPKHPGANYNLRILAVSNGKPEVSLSYFKLAPKVSPKQTQYWLSMIELLIKTDQLDNARGILQQSLDFGLENVKTEQPTRQFKLESV